MTTPNVRAILLYEGSIETFLELRMQHISTMSITVNLFYRKKQNNLGSNPLIRGLCPRLDSIGERMAVEGLSFALLIRTDEESVASFVRSDVIMNSLNFEEEVRNEDYRSHHVQVGIINIESCRNKLKRVINHDMNLEMLVFAHLYPHDRGA